MELIERWSFFKLILENSLEILNRSNRWLSLLCLKTSSDHFLNGSSNLQDLNRVEFSVIEVTAFLIVAWLSQYIEILLLIVHWFAKIMYTAKISVIQNIHYIVLSIVGFINPQWRLLIQWFWIIRVYGQFPVYFNSAIMPVCHIYWPFKVDYLTYIVQSWATYIREFQYV